MKSKQYVLIYIDPEKPFDLREGDTGICGIGTMDQVIEQCCGDYNHLEDAEDNRIPRHLIFELDTGKKVEFVFPKPRIKILI